LHLNAVLGISLVSVLYIGCIKSAYNLCVDFNRSVV
jgi:hypothetical protein